MTGVQTCALPIYNEENSEKRNEIAQKGTSLLNTAISKNPNDAQLYLVLASLYNKIAFPKDKNKKALPINREGLCRNSKIFLCRIFSPVNIFNYAYFFIHDFFRGCKGKNISGHKL